MSHQFTARRQQGEVVPSPDTSCVVCGLRYRHHPRPGVEVAATDQPTAEQIAQWRDQHQAHPSHFNSEEWAIT